jgi:myo-inositol 2-dehydrogenase/D-chiro-inositol 1-dehydrogenase
MTLGVGILGAGPVVQAIHLPALARLADLFHVANIMDISPEVAASVAGRVGAGWSTSMEQLLADDGVEVVAICSPSRFHADQVIATMRAGKRAVLCEKPFATSREEAERIATVSAETGVPVIVGAMHTFDPGWLAANGVWGDLPDIATLIRSRILLPPNARFEDFATEVVTRPEFGPADLTDPDARAGLMSGGILGLAIHDLPLVRTFLPAAVDVVVEAAELLKPWGYLVTLRAGERMVQLLGAVSNRWNPEWTFEVFGPESKLEVAFTPSYVQAGSAEAAVTTSTGRFRLGPFDHNGYEGEWRHLHALANGTAEGGPALDELIGDLTFAADVAEGASAIVRDGGLA